MTRRDQISVRALARRCVLACVALVVLYFAVPVNAEGDATMIGVRVVVTVAAIVGVVAAIRWQVLRHLHEPDAPIGGLIVSIVAGLLVFAMVDYLIAYHLSGEFIGLRTRLDALYFALTTVLTVGFGDISANGQLARGVLCVQMVFNVAILATAASLLTRQIGARARARS